MRQSEILFCSNFIISISGMDFFVLVFVALFDLKSATKSATKSVGEVYIVRFGFFVID